MALLITDECISCGACLPECPNEAIFETRSDAEGKGHHVGDGQGVGDNIYVINTLCCLTIVNIHKIILFDRRLKLSIVGV